MKTPSPHSHFFSSLKHLEKRLKLDNSETPTQSSNSPLYLIDFDEPSNGTDLKQSETPLQFLSNSPLFPLSQETPSQLNPTQPQERVDGVNEIQLLMQLLGLSDCKTKRVQIDLGCDDAFYEKIVGVKGPKSKRQVERLELWIEHLLSGEGRESFRLAHLLLGKASLIHSEVLHSVESFEIPSTIDEFLHNDPPTDEIASSSHHGKKQ